MKTLNFSYDRETDVLTIEGVKYAGSLFRVFAEDRPSWEPFRLRRRGGVVELQSMRRFRPMRAAVGALRERLDR